MIRIIADIIDVNDVQDYLLNDGVLVGNWTTTGGEPVRLRARIEMRRDVKLDAPAEFELYLIPHGQEEPLLTFSLSAPSGQNNPLELRRLRP